MQIDFELSGHGTLYLFRPITRAAHAWVEEHRPSFIERSMKEHPEWFNDLPGAR